MPKSDQKFRIEVWRFPVRIPRRKHLGKMCQTSMSWVLTAPCYRMSWGWGHGVNGDRAGLLVLFFPSDIFDSRVSELSTSNWTAAGTDVVNARYLQPISQARLGLLHGRKAIACCTTDADLLEFDTIVSALGDFSSKPSDAFPTTAWKQTGSKAVRSTPQ